MSEFKVSIIMGIYNCEQTLGQAIESILDQTYTEWKLIMCDDGSTDNTFFIAEEYKERYPDKIILLKNKKNMGLNYTLNHCLDKADTEYIARMDGDDLCIKTRLQKEVEYLDQHPEFAIVSCSMIMFDEMGEWGRKNVIKKPQISDFCRHTPFFCHAAAMIRREAIESVGRYTVDKRFLRVEDCNLWFKMYAAGYRGANLTQALYMVRDDRNAIGRRSYKARMNGCYVMYDGFKQLKMPITAYRFVALNFIIETIKCIIPDKIYEIIHKYKYRK